MSCRRFRVTGRVQDVWFRATTCERAAELELTGWVRNLASGEVELVACGAPHRLAALERWLWQGPPQARVSRVTSAAAPDEPDHATFEIVDD